MSFKGYHKADLQNSSIRRILLMHLPSFLTTDSCRLSFSIPCFLPCTIISLHLPERRPVLLVRIARALQYSQSPSWKPSPSEPVGGLPKSHRLLVAPLLPTSLVNEWIVLVVWSPCPVTTTTMMWPPNLVRKVSGNASRWAGLMMMIMMMVIILGGDYHQKAFFPPPPHRGRGMSYWTPLGPSYVWQ